MVQVDPGMSSVKACVENDMLVGMRRRLRDPKGPRTQIIGLQGYEWYLDPKTPLFRSLDP